MDAYTGFAYVYDEYMDNIPYPEWTGYLIDLLKENGIKKGDFVCDLGCGTGTVAQILDDEGFDVAGLDLSEDMLIIAAEKAAEAGKEIIYSHQDMRDFALPYEADAFISICDSMNYITSKEDITDVFKCVYENLKEGGYLIFDLKTIHFFRDILAENTYAENREDSAFVWDNFYDKESRNNEYDLAVFIKNEDDTFDRYQENHYQHGFFIEEVKEAAKTAGLNIRAIYDAFTHDEPKETSERLYFVMQKGK